MSLKFTRKKTRVILLSVLYRLSRILPMSRARKFKLFLDLEWIFDRLAYELSYQMYEMQSFPPRYYSMKFILEELSEKDTVLDLGCKYGDISFILSEKVEKVIGIDHDKAAIQIAKEKYKKANLEFYHREALEFLKEQLRSFDVLILSHILEHLDEPKEFLQQFKNYFKRIYIEVPDFDKNYLNHFRKDFNVKLIYTDNDHIWEFDRADLKSLVEEVGLEIYKSEYRFGVQKLWCKVP